MAPETWRRLPAHVGSPLEHIARSDALARASTQPTLWWHSTREPVLILGAGQSDADIDLDACRAAGITILRRTSGGTAVFATPWLLGLDLALPVSHPLVLADIVESYAWFGATWAHALQSLGIDARSISIDEARTAAQREPQSRLLIKPACFGSVAPYEVVLGPRKLVGLSQVRRRHVQILQSGLYLRFSASDIIDLLVIPERASARTELHAVAVGLNDVAHSEIGAEQVREAFEQTLQERLNVRLHDGEWSDEESRQAATYLAGQGA
jgi:lipoate-protein ligase A